MSDYFDNLLGNDEEQEKKKAAVKKEAKTLDGREHESKEARDLKGASGIQAQKTTPGAFAAKEGTVSSSAASKRTNAALAAVIILIPVTVLISYLAGDSKYYIASVIIMLLAMLPFFVSFENRAPQAREIVTLAVMTAIAVAARIVFIWLPWFTPMAGFIIITAAGLGAQAGFMTGALAIIVSNIVFGQGPWTPWQMFCYSLIGLIAGFLAKKGLISPKHLIRSAVITFILTFAMSGIILDTCTVFLSMNYMYEGEPAAIYLSGIPVNAANGAGSAAAVFFFMRPILEKLERIKTKYGL